VKLQDDGILARAAASGDAAAFTELVRRHERRVRPFLARLTRGEGADDLAQETFVKAWRMAASYRGEGSYEAWLLRIAWRAFLSDLRSRKPTGEVDESLESASADPYISIDVKRALADLEPRERAAALLCFGEGYSHGEAARIMEVPLGTLKSVAARAKAKLARHLEGEGA
jgi:RNA polymerase sigma factor (sigma-70 family)